MKRTIYKKPNILEMKNTKENEISNFNSLNKKHLSNASSRKDLNFYNIIETIDLNSSDGDDEIENNINNNNFLNAKKAKNIKNSKIKEKFINLDEDENNDLIEFDLNEKYKTNKKMVKKKVSKINQKKNFSKLKNEDIIEEYTLTDSGMNSSSENFSNNNISSINCPSFNFESNFINSSREDDFSNIFDNKIKNENVINLGNNRNNIIDNVLTKFLSKKRGKEESEIKEEDRFTLLSKKEKEKQMPNFSKIKLSNNRNYPKSYTNENWYNKNILSKKEKYKKKDILIPEIKILYNFIIRNKIEKAINSIKTEIFPNNKFNSCLKEIREIYGDSKLIIILIKSLISLLKENINENISKNNKNKKNEFFSTKNILNNYIILKDKENNNYFNFDKEGSNEYNPIKIIDDRDNEINEKYINKININNDIDMRNGKIVSIESHYNKNKDGNIYKYKVGFLSGKSIIFYCFDPRCISYGIFDLETKKFRVQKGHNLRYSSHNFIINYEKNNEVIFKEMNQKKYLDSQVYKEGKNSIVRFYY